MHLGGLGGESAKIVSGRPSPTRGKTMSKVIEKTLADLWDSSRSYAMSSPLPEIYFSCGKALAVIEAEIEQRVKAARREVLEEILAYDIESNPGNLAAGIALYVSELIEATK